MYWCWAWHFNAQLKSLFWGETLNKRRLSTFRQRNLNNTAIVTTTLLPSIQLNLHLHPFHSVAVDYPFHKSLSVAMMKRWLRPKLIFDCLFVSNNTLELIIIITFIRLGCSLMKSLILITVDTSNFYHLVTEIATERKNGMRHSQFHWQVSFRNMILYVYRGIYVLNAII